MGWLCGGAEEEPAGGASEELEPAALVLVGVQPASPGQQVSAIRTLRLLP